MDPRQAAVQIAEIQSRLSHAQTFRGYRSITVAATGLLALVAAALQPVLVSEPVKSPFWWLGLWLSVAAVGVVGVGIELAVRCRRAGSPWFVRVTVSAVSRFLPCVVAGAAVTAVLATTAPETLWLLPGLWAVLFSLGVFASCTVMPKEIVWVGVFYLAAGIASLLLARNATAFAPEAMAIPFGTGQLLTAGILYWRLECAGVTEE
jgi:hypothetical protein